MRKTAALSDAHIWSSNYSILRRWQPHISKYNATNCDLRLASRGQGCGQDVYVFVSLIQTLPLRPRRCLWLLEAGTSEGGERVHSNWLFCRAELCVVNISPAVMKNPAGDNAFNKTQCLGPNAPFLWQPARHRCWRSEPWDKLTVICFQANCCYVSVGVLGLGPCIAANKNLEKFPWKLVSRVVAGSGLNAKSIQSLINVPGKYFWEMSCWKCGLAGCASALTRLPLALMRATQVTVVSQSQPPLSLCLLSDCPSLYF